MSSRLNMRKAKRSQSKAKAREAMKGAVNEALSDLLPSIISQTVEAMRQTPPSTNFEENPNQTNYEYVEAPRANEIHVWLERFQKQKPQSFSSATQPIDAENWISHIEKIFKVLGCDEQYKVKLATYKLEGDAQRWWKAYTQAKGGDEFVDTLDWESFREVFFQQYFSNADKEAIVREYATIRQGGDESVTTFMTRFLRLAGLVGAAAGSSFDQAKKFKWAVHERFRSKIINFTYYDVAEVADAAKNLELERLEFMSSRQDDSLKRNRDGQPIQSAAPTHHDTNRPPNFNNRNFNNNNRTFNNQTRPYQPYNHTNLYQSQTYQPNQNQQNRPNNPTPQRNPNTIPLPNCNRCGKNHPGNTCQRNDIVCYKCGRAGHMAKDCRNPGGANAGGNRGVPPVQGGRVFAMTETQAADSQGTVSGTLFIDDRPFLTLFDTGSTHSIISQKRTKYLKVSPSLLQHPLSIATPMENSITISY